MENILENLDGWYNAHHSLSDFYEKSEATLRAALEHGEDFYAEWGCKKEIHYATVARCGGLLRVSARAVNDELQDITDTVIWDAAGGNDFADDGHDALKKLYDLDDVEEHFDAFMGLLSGSYLAHSEHSVTLEGPVSWDKLVETLDEVETAAEEGASNNYNELVEIAKEFIANIPNEEADYYELVEIAKEFIANMPNEEADYYSELERGYNQDRI